jgi:NitT/TauT family transport system ATP-binding protein
MLKMRDVTVRYPATRAGASDVLALDRISIEIDAGEFVVVIGPSGCGKTSLLELIGGFRTATSGSILMNEEPLAGPHPEIGVVFQEDSTFPWLTTAQNIEFSLKHRRVPSDERAQRVAAMIRLIGLQGFEKHRPAQLSGGMRQRVALARALAPKPKLLLMDEPFGALDEQSRLRLGDELLRIWRATGCTVVFITHSLSEASMLADRVVVLSARPGRVVDIIVNPLDRDRSSAALGTPQFNEMSAKLWRLLRAQSPAEEVVA